MKKSLQLTNFFRKTGPLLHMPIFHDDREPSLFWSRRAFLLAALFFIALLLRVAQFMFLRANDPSFDHLLPVADTNTYDVLAQKILGGDWLLRSQPIHFMGPLYAYFLAVVYSIFGHEYVAVHAVQFFMGALSSAIVYLAACQWFSNRVAFIAGLLPALSATLIVYEGYLLPESLVFLLASLFVLVAGLIRRNPYRKYFWFLLGLILGLAALQRPSFIICIFGVAFWIRFLNINKDGYRRAIYFALFLSGILIALAPATLHNRMIGGEWVLVTNNGPINFYIGNGVEASGVFGMGEHFEQRARDVSSGKTTWGSLLANEIQSDPSRWLVLMLKKSYLYWAAYDPPDNFNYALYKKFSPLTQLGQFPFYVIAALGFIGMMVAWPHRRSLMELYLTVLFFMVSIVIVFVSGRFRLPVMIPMSIFAGVAFWKAIYWIRTQQWPQFLAGGLTAMVVVFALNLYSSEPLPIRINDYLMLAEYFDADDDPEGAIRTMREAVMAFESPPNGDPRFEDVRKMGLFNARGALAERLVKAARWQEAREVLERQMSYGVYDDFLALMLVRVYGQLGEREKSLALAREMMSKAPGNPVWRSMAQEMQIMSPN